MVVPEAPPRPVRIARGSAVLPGRAAAPPTLDPYAEVALPPHGNRAGLHRARRMLLLYLGTLALLYGIVVVLVAGSHYSGVRDDLLLYVALSVIASISALAGFVLTVGRAPFAVYVDQNDLVVRERFGGLRRFPIDPTLRIGLRGREGPGFLSPEPTETVRVSSSRHKEREYVLEEGLLARLPELADRLPAR